MKIRHITPVATTITCLCILFLYSCKSGTSSGEGGDLTVIKFEEDSELFRPAELFRNITCIQLEMTDKSVLGKIKKIIDAEGNLVVLTRDNEVVVFNREDGKYLRHLGSPGEGPEDYIDAKDMYYNLGSGTIDVYDRMRNDIVSYGLNGEFAGKRQLPKLLSYVQSIESAPDGTLLVCNQLTGGLSNPSDYAFTLIKPDGGCEDIDPFAPVTVNGFAAIYANRPMSVCGDEIKFAGFMSDTISCVKNDRISPIYKLDLVNKIIPKRVAADLKGFEAEFYEYCIRENLITGINNMFETEKYLVLNPLMEETYGCYWIDKEAKAGYHISSSAAVASQLRKVVQGKSIIRLIGYNGKELISCYEDVEIYKDLFVKVLSEDDPVDVALPESVVSAIENIDPDGNPFLLIYSD